MANILDPNKRRLDARAPLRDMGFTEQHIQIMEQQAIKTVDRLAAVGAPVNMAFITILMSLELVAQMSTMSRSDKRDMIAKAQSACAAMAREHCATLELAKQLAWQNKARVITDREDAWTELENASELNVTEH